MASAAEAVLPPSVERAPRTLRLFDPDAQPQSWNERMADGEFAVLPSGAVPVQTETSLHDILDGQPYCVVFDTFAGAETYARAQVLNEPAMRCRIYDHHGLAREPLAEFSGTAFKQESELSPRFRRWGGCVLFFGGVLLTGIDWVADFRYFWPSMIGTRMIPTGLVLLVIELGIQLNAFDKRRRSGLTTEQRS